MICGFCHKEIPEKVGVPEGGEQSCGACLGGGVVKSIVLIVVIPIRFQGSICVGF